MSLRLYTGVGLSVSDTDSDSDSDNVYMSFIVCSVCLHLDQLVMTAVFVCGLFPKEDCRKQPLNQITTSQVEYLVNMLSHLSPPSL